MADRCRVLFTLALFAGIASAQNTPFTISNLSLSGAVNNAGQISGTGTATVAGLASGAVAVTLTGFNPPSCRSPFTLSETFAFDSSDSLTLSEVIPVGCNDNSATIALTTSFNVTGGTGVYSGRIGSGTIALTVQTDPSSNAGPLTVTGNGSGALITQKGGTSFTISNLTLSGAQNSAGQISGTGTATLSGLAAGTVPFTLTGVAPPPQCGTFVTLSETFTFNSSDSLTLSESISNCANDVPPTVIVSTNFNVTGGTGIYSGRAGSGTLILLFQTTPGTSGAGPLTITGSGSGTLTPQVQNTSLAISNLSFSGTVNGAGQISGSGTASVSLPTSGSAALSRSAAAQLPSGAVTFTETGTANNPCGGVVTLSQTLTFNSNDSLTLGETFPQNCTASSFTVSTPFNATGGTGAWSGWAGSGTVTFTTQSNQTNGVGPFTGTGSGSGALSTQTPVVTPAGVVPVYSAVPAVQPGEWVSIYGTALASSAVTWNGDFPTTLGGTSVTVDGKPAYLWFVSPTQINLQTPDDTSTLPATVPIVVTTASGTFTWTVTLAPYGPSFSLLDGTHVAGIILRSNGLGAYGGGTYDILGPTGSSLGYATVAAKAGDVVELFAVGLGPTTPPERAGQVFSGSASTASPVSLLINNQKVTPGFAGLSGAGLYQINLTVPAGLGTGDVPLVATVGGVQTPSTVVISLQ